MIINFDENGIISERVGGIFCIRKFDNVNFDIESGFHGSKIHMYQFSLIFDKFWRALLVEHFVLITVEYDFGHFLATNKTNEMWNLFPTI